jgi:hypothetical protein
MKLGGLWGRSYEKLSVFEWHKWFKDSHQNIEDDERSGHPGSHITMKMLKKC